MKTIEKFETIVVERPEPRIARIVMNRPEARNAQNLQMTYDLNAAFDHAVQDDAVKVIILAGSGPHFSSGHDLRPGGKNNAGVDFPPVGNWGGFAEPNAHGRFARSNHHTDTADSFLHLPISMPLFFASFSIISNAKPCSYQK